MHYNRCNETNYIMTNKTFAPFELKMTEQQAFDGLKSTYGNELTAADVRAFAAMNNIGYATVPKKIKKYRDKIPLFFK